MSALRTILVALAGGTFLAACAGAPASTSTPETTASVPFSRSVSLPSNVGPGDTCADAYVIVAETARTNFQLGSEYYRTEDYCRAYPYLKWLLDNEPLFTNDTPDDRTFLRMSSIYEWFASKVDSTNRAEKRVYLDSSLAMRQAGEAAMDAQGVSFDHQARILRGGFFYVQHADVYDDAEKRQFDAFNTAFEVAPDSLDDWYIEQLFIGSGLAFAENLEGRAEYVIKLAQFVDSPEKKTYYESIAESFTAPPPDTGVASDDAVIELVAKLDAGSLSATEARTLLATSISQPERLEALGQEPASITRRVVRLPVIQDDLNDPRVLVSVSFQEYADGNASRGNELFNRAISRSTSNQMKADFYYSRCARDYGNCTADIARVLQLVPNHPHGLFKRAGLIGDAVGRPRTTEGRAAYWCLADIYRNVAASVNDSRISSAARRAASSYDRAAPTREQYFLSPGWEPGDTVTASLGSYGTCTTRVR